MLLSLERAVLTNPQFDRLMCLNRIKMCLAFVSSVMLLSIIVPFSAHMT